MKQLKTGRAGEYLTASYLTRLFDEVFECPSHSRYDLLAILNNKPYKFQVKTTASTFLKGKNKWVRWDIKKKISNTGKQRLYDKDEVDIFAFVFLPSDKVIFVVNENVGKTYQKKLEFVLGFEAQQSLKSCVEILDILREREHGESK
jgi:hypothetical protein|tara:strand:+ start:316 stop:756 length:441 start_codon:yes stop_codon:yes gene_type:complete